MFDRRQFKAVARRQLQHRYRTPLLATVALLLIMAALCGNFIGQHIRQLRDLPGLWSFSQTAGGFALHLNLPHVVRHTSLIAWLIAVLIEGVIAIAYRYLFCVLSHTTEAQPFSTFTDGCTRWRQGFLGLLMQRTFTYLWALLLVIPGIVKHYAYSQTLYVLAEYPQLGARRAMDMSKAITAGHKMDLFLMDLSFAGWLALSAVTCGIAGLYLVPYRTMALTNAYHALLAEAVAKGTVTMEAAPEAAPVL